MTACRVHVALSVTSSTAVGSASKPSRSKSRGSDCGTAAALPALRDGGPSSTPSSIRGTRCTTLIVIAGDRVVEGAVRCVVGARAERRREPGGRHACTRGMSEGGATTEGCAASAWEDDERPLQAQAHADVSWHLYSNRDRVRPSLIGTREHARCACTHETEELNFARAPPSTLHFNFACDCDPDQ